MHWLDILMIGIFLLNILLGYHKGLILTLLSVTSYVLASFFAKTYYMSLAAWIQGKPELMRWFTTIVLKHVDNRISVETLDATGKNIDFQEQITTLLKYPTFLEEYLVKKTSLSHYANDTIEFVKNTIVSQLTVLLINAVSMIILFLVIRTAIQLAGYLLNQGFKLPLLKTVNHIGGIAVGGIRGIIIILLIILIMIPIATISPYGEIAKAFEQSTLTYWIFNSVFVLLFNLF